MFRTKLTLVGVVLAAAIGASPALAGPNTFITDTLAPGGSMSLAHKWFLIEHADQTAQPQGYRFITDTLAPGGGPSVVSVPTGSGFDWADAGVGAGATAGIALMLLGSVRVLNRRNTVAV
jgi:hypothetical protein